jgi:hypothetical protein
MKQSDILLLGGAAILAYFLFKDNGAFFDSFSGGGGAGGGGFLDFLTPNPSPGGGGSIPAVLDSGGGPVTPTASQTSSTRTINVSPAQSWTGVTYGNAGQPSVRFLTKTIQEASSPSASQQTKMAAAAAYAGAPPRVVAKIKAGKIY